MHIWSLTRSEA